MELEHSLDYVTLTEANKDNINEDLKAHANQIIMSIRLAKAKHPDQPITEAVVSDVLANLVMDHENPPYWLGVVVGMALQKLDSFRLHRKTKLAN